METNKALLRPQVSDNALVGFSGLSSILKGS